MLVLLLLVWHAFNSSVAYFVDWAQAEPAQRIYNADFRAVAAYLDEHKTDEPVYAGTDRLVDLDQRVYKLYEPRRQDLVWFAAKTSRRFRPRATLSILFRLRLRTCHRHSHCL